MTDTHVLLAGIVGSTAYGLAGPDSDIDRTRAPRPSKVEWACSAPECDKTFMQYASQISDPSRPHCSNQCRSRHQSLLRFPLEARAEAAERYRSGEHTGMLAKAYGVNGQTMRRALKDLGVEIDRRRSGAASWARRNDVPPDEGDMYTGFRHCKTCRQRKPMDDFYWIKQKGKTATRKRACKSCHYKAAKAGANLRANRRKYLYGMSVEEYDRRFATQGGKCAICREPAQDDEGRGLHVDHHHSSGAIRGLLCDFCNRGLGMFRDNVDFLRAAVAYLERGGATAIDQFPERIIGLLDEIYLGRAHLPVNADVVR